MDDPAATETSPDPTNDTADHGAVHAEGTPETPAMVCLECGAPLVYRGSGRRPRYCSSSCRHRAWERRRAAAEGLTATEVVELPPRPTRTTYTRAGVIGWLQDRPRRFAEVVAALPDTAESVRQLDAARRRLWNLGVRTPAEHRAEEWSGTELARLRAEHADTVTECERLRRENRVLRDRLTLAVQNAGAQSSAVPPQHPTGSKPPPPGYRAVTVAGRKFHVPQAWSRTQARTWCRTHPDKALD